MLHLFGRKTLIQLKLHLLLTVKSLRIMLFQSRNSHTGPLFKFSKILKSFDKAALENYIFISKSLKGLLPSIFNSWFNFCFELHSYYTGWSNLGYLKIPSYCTQKYGRYLMFVMHIYLEPFTKLPSKCHISSAESK